MKTIVIACSLLMTALGLLGADPDLKADIAKAAGKLNDASGYAWTTRMDSGGSSGRPSTPVKGTTEKGGVSHIVITRGENDMEALVKGSKSAVKIQDSWHSLDSIPDAGGGGGGQRNPARMIARLIQSFKPPGALALELSGKASNFRKSEDAVTADLTEEAVKELIQQGGRGGGNSPTISNAKGTVKFWSPGGVLSKCEIRLQATVTSNGNDREVDRTTFMEVKEVGVAKINAPEEALKKLE